MKIAIYTDIKTYKSKGLYVVDVEAVLQALYNLITTERGERRYKFYLGFTISDYVFKNFDFTGAFQLKSDLIADIRAQEPRVNPVFSLSEVTPDPVNNRYKLRLVFTIKGFGDEQFEFIGAIFK